MDYLPYIVIGIAVAGMVAFIIYLKTRKRVAHYADGEFVQLGIDKKYRQFKHDLVTPGGVKVKSTVPVPAVQQALIDEGFQATIDRYDDAFVDWIEGMNLSDYEVYLIDPMGTNQVTEPGSPCIYVNGIQTAGTCLGVHPRTQLENVIVVAPHQADSGWAYPDYFKNTIAYEGEHAVERKNIANAPLGVFQAFVGSTDSHPHDLTPWTGQERQEMGLFAKRRVPCGITKPRPMP